MTCYRCEVCGQEFKEWESEGFHLECPQCGEREDIEQLVKCLGDGDNEYHTKDESEVVYIGGGKDVTFAKRRGDELMKSFADNFTWAEQCLIASRLEGRCI